MADELERFEPEKDEPFGIRESFGPDLRKRTDRKKPAEMAPGLRFRIVLLLDVLMVLAVAILAFFLIRHLMNESFLHDYERGTYSEKKEEKLKEANFVEGYLPWYNLGNVSFQNEKYDDAISNYKKALEYHPSNGKECPIRINLALAMIHKINFNAIATDKDAERAINQLLAARAVLCEEGCADADDDNGHSEEAEKLKKDIDDMIDQLRQQQEQQNQDQNQDQQQNQNQDQDQNQDQQQNQDQSEREKEIQDELERNRQQDQQERQQTQDDYTNQNDPGGGGGWGGGSQDPDGKTW